VVVIEGMVVVDMEVMEVTPMAVVMADEEGTEDEGDTEVTMAVMAVADQVMVMEVEVTEEDIHNNMAEVKANHQQVPMHRVLI